MTQINRKLLNKAEDWEYWVHPLQWFILRLLWGGCCQLLQGAGIEGMEGKPMGSKASSVCLVLQGPGELGCSLSIPVGRRWTLLPLLTGRVASQDGSCCRACLIAAHPHRAGNLGTTEALECSGMAERDPGSLALYTEKSGRICTAAKDSGSWCWLDIWKLASIMPAGSQMGGGVEMISLGIAKERHPSLL